MRRLFVWLCAGLLCCCTGCTALLEREYYVNEPHVLQKTEELPAGEVVVGSKRAIKDVILRMIESGIEQRDLRAVDYSGDFGNDIEEALYEVQEEEPLAVYAVSHSSYDKSKILTQQTAAINIKYKRDVSTVLSVSGITEFRERLSEAHRTYLTKLVLDISFYDGELYDATGVFDSLYYAEPDRSVERPQINSIFYPELSHSSTRRIVEIEFLYTLPREVLLKMAADAKSSAQSLLMEQPGGLDEPLKALWIYEALTAHTEYAAEIAAQEADSGVTAGVEVHTAYGALAEGLAVSEGYAMAFHLLCRESGLESRIVKGRKDREEFFWNLIELEGHWYHVDTVRVGTAENPDYSGFLKSDEEMTAEDIYSWDTGKLPAAQGGLNAETVLARREGEAV